MKGKYNPNTGHYEGEGGTELFQERDMPSGLDAEEQEEYRQMQKIEAEGGTYLERWAKELRVKASDLLLNITQNNSFDRWTSCRTYEEFRLLKQTLVEENRPLKKIVGPWLDALDAAGLNKNKMY